MSLDVYLVGDPVEKDCECPHCGHSHKARETPYLFEANITHNLGKTAFEAGIFNALWCPEEIGAQKAGQLIKPLRDGLELLKSDPLRFKKFDPPNGWGSYNDFLPWLEKYLAACEQFPRANIRVSR